VSGALTRSRFGRRAVGLVTAFTVTLAVLMQRDAILDAVGRLASLSPWWLVAAAAAEVISYGAMAELQRLLLVAGGIRMSHRSVLALAWVSDAVNASLPVGAPAAGAYTFRYFTRRGASPGVAGWVMVASGLMSTTALVALALGGVQLRRPIFACAVLELAVTATLVVASAAIAILVLTKLSARPARLEAVANTVRRAAGAVQRLIRRRAANSMDAHWPGSHFTRPITVGWTTGVVAFGLAVINWISDAAVLALSLVAVGAPVPLRALLVAYALSQAAASVPVLPGSLGVAEGSLALALACAGVHPAAALEAALVYRLITHWLQLPLGWALWAGVRRREQSDPTPI
jgi:putative heme transporter